MYHVTARIQPGEIASRESSAAMPTVEAAFAWLDARAAEFAAIPDPGWGNPQATALGTARFTISGWPEAFSHQFFAMVRRSLGGDGAGLRIATASATYHSDDAQRAALDARGSARMAGLDEDAQEDAAQMAFGIVDGPEPAKSW